MTTRERVHQLVEQLSDDELKSAENLLKRIHDIHQDPVWRAISSAPEYDEPETIAEASAVYEADEAIDRGDVVSHEEIRRELGL
ncbi:MAG: hypothetical protein WD401_04500 [Thermomicrobiaceae bacterium]